jgi:hypothetical protein
MPAHFHLKEFMQKLFWLYRNSCLQVHVVGHSQVWFKSQKSGEKELVCSVHCTWDLQIGSIVLHSCNCKSLCIKYHILSFQANHTCVTHKCCMHVMLSGWYTRFSFACKKAWGCRWNRLLSSNSSGRLCPVPAFPVSFQFSLFERDLAIVTHL